MRILSVKVDKQFGYGYLEEIVVKRADQKHYKFKEGDFPDLHLNDIEYTLLLIAQQKINNLDGDVIVDFVTALKMFTRSITVKNRIKDVHLGVIYKNKKQRKRLMRLDELHKYSNETLQSVYKTLHTRLKNLTLGFNPKSDMPRRAWAKKDLDRTETILRKIDVVLLKRRIMRSLEVLVGGRNSDTDRRLMQRTVITNIQSDALQHFTVMNENPSSVNIKQHCVFKLKHFKKEYSIASNTKEKYEHVGPEVTKFTRLQDSQDDEEIM
ncbi:hypothetical protein Tco_0965332 [Tanacetum coccineum]